MQDPNALTAVMASPSNVNNPSWYVDSGATHHVSAKLENPRYLNEYKGKGKLVISNGKGMKICQIGST